MDQIRIRRRNEFPTFAQEEAERRAGYRRTQSFISGGTSDHAKISFLTLVMARRSSARCSVSPHVLLGDSPKEASLRIRVF